MGKTRRKGDTDAIVIPDSDSDQIRRKERKEIAKSWKEKELKKMAEDVRKSADDVDFVDFEPAGDQLVTDTEEDADIRELQQLLPIHPQPAAQDVKSRQNKRWVQDAKRKKRRRTPGKPHKSPKEILTVNEQIARGVPPWDVDVK